ncbi:MAG: hypothetical protein ACOYNC_00285 [Bacteroidales bacterium]
METKESNMKVLTEMATLLSEIRSILESIVNDNELRREFQEEFCSSGEAMNLLNGKSEPGDFAKALVTGNLFATAHQAEIFVREQLAISGLSFQADINGEAFKC